MIHRIGVCSWSLRPEDPGDLADKAGACGVSWVQLALDSIRRGDWDHASTVKRLAASGIEVASGMMAFAGEDYSTIESIRQTGGLRPDDGWEENLLAAEENASLASRLGLGLVTFHAGFIPEDKGDPLRGVMLERLRRVADVFAEQNIRIGLETGQESAQTLLDALRELRRPNVGVNFDPANMVLYGAGDPVEALRLLAGRVEQIHVKDALPAPQAGAWGTETPAGRGGVDWEGFFNVVREADLRVDLMIEREGGEGGRVEDIIAARELIESKLEYEDAW